MLCSKVVAETAYPAGAEDVAVGKVLRGKVANCQARQNNLCARRRNCIQLLVDDVPLSIHNRLILRWVV
jgi:hypothetical protein